MADTIYVGQTPVVQNDFDGANHGWGMEWTVSADSTCVGGRAWVPLAGRPTTFFWQLWRISDAALLAETNLNAAGHGSPGSGAWMSFTSALFTTPGNVALDDAEDYIVNVYFQGGNGVYTDNGTETFPVGSGGLVVSTTGRFNNGSGQAAMPGTSYAAYFFADVSVEAAGTTASAGVAAGTGVANAGAAGVSPSAGVSVGTGTALGATVEVTATTAFAGVASGVGQAFNPTIREEGDVHLYKFGPCEPWTPVWPTGGDCNVLLLTGAAAVTGTAVQAASEILYQLTAQRFGLCRVKLRPCRQSCSSTFPWGEWWQYGTYPQPYWWAGTWYNLTCGACPGDTCSCVAIEETVLPGPVYDIVEVKLNGVILERNVDYRVDDYRKLVRLGGELWPFCQNMNLADTEDTTWSVTVDYGEIVPAIGSLAVGELAAEIVKYLLCLECQLPQGVVDISRQGVSMSIASIADLFKTGFIQLRMCDLFIKTSNPNHMQARAGIYDIDGPNYRAVGTTP